MEKSMLGKSKAKYIQSLGQKKHRDTEGRFIAEGPKVVQELLSNQPALVEEIFALKEWIDAHQPDNIISKITEIEKADLERISQTKTPNQVLAVVKKLPPVNEFKLKGTFTLVLDTIQDPGNLGTIIRIADWFNISQIICSPDCADVYNPKVVQSSMGSIARVNLKYVDLAEWLSSHNEVPVLAMMLDGTDVRSMKNFTEGLIIVGNESKGISDEVAEFATQKITIAGKGRAESLNAAVATGIVLSHLVK